MYRKLGFVDMTDNTPKLCYVEGAFAYFTTQDLDVQWGDDWDDAPYEHNAGRPYEFRPHDAGSGKVPWHITKVAWDGPFLTPADIHGPNSPYSVESINAGAVAWLASEAWIDKKTAIRAGVSIAEFCELIQGGGGMVYLPIERKQP